jgi:hypothetical protein
MNFLKKYILYLPRYVSVCKIISSVGDCISDQCGPIAQSVEQMAFNHWVEGSSPSRITINFNSLGHR